MKNRIVRVLGVLLVVRFLIGCGSGDSAIGTDQAGKPKNPPPVAGEGGTPNASGKKGGGLAAPGV